MVLENQDDKSRRKPGLGYTQVIFWIVTPEVFFFRKAYRFSNSSGLAIFFLYLHTLDLPPYPECQWQVQIHGDSLLKMY